MRAYAKFILLAVLLAIFAVALGACPSAMNKNSGLGDPGSPSAPGDSGTQGGGSPGGNPGSGGGSGSSPGGSAITISFDSNGGSAAPPSITVPKVPYIIELPAAGSVSKAGYVFGGWSRKPGGAIVYQSDFLVEASLTLYAVWEPEGALYHEITFYGNGSTGGEVPPAMQVFHGYDAGISYKRPTRDGHWFMGWAIAEDGGSTAGFLPGGDIFNVTRSKTLRAVWQDNYNWKAAGVGRNHTAAIMNDGSLWVWGQKAAVDYGPTPARIGLDAWAAMFKGVFHTLVLRADGTLWAWGSNANGQLGDGTTTDRAAPVQISHPQNRRWATAAAGLRHSAAIDEDGAMWVWGEIITTIFLRSYGSSPIRLGGAANWVSVSAGWEHTAALNDGGALWVWGSGRFGQLGNGVTVNRYFTIDEVAPIYTPTGLANWASVSAGNMYTLAIREDGLLWGWGYNGQGRVGNTTMIHQFSPILAGFSWQGWIWEQVATGANHSLGIRNGSLFSWGWNGTGQLGISNTTQHWSPVPTLQGQGTWVSVSADVHSAGIRRDGSLWTWGTNVSGQLGDGTTTQRNSPIRPAPPQ